MRTAACDVLRFVQLLFVFCGACVPDSGQYTIDVSWEDPRPDSLDGLFVLVRVEDNTSATPTVLVEEPPTALLSEGKISLRSIPNGPRRVVVVEIRRAGYRNAQIAYAGQSAEFEAKAGDSQAIPVGLRRQTQESRTFSEVPSVPSTQFIRYELAPWGTADDSQPFARVVGEAGAHLPETEVLAFDERDVARAKSVGQTTTDASGAFVLEVQSSGSGPPSRVYLSGANRELVLSDSSTRSGLQAELVHTVTWTASLNGKVPGSSFPNPHDIRAQPVTGRGLFEAETEFEVFETSIRDASTNDGYGPVMVGGRRWIRASNVEVGGSEFGAAAFDPVRSRVVFLPSSEQGRILNTTQGEPSDNPDSVWEWDGYNWAPISPVGERPSGRFGAAMAYDGFTGEIVLYGGRSFEAPGGADAFVVDMWSWNGERWRQILTDGGPSRRFLHGMAWDSRRGRLVLFGGGGSGPGLDGVWEWDGKRWHGPLGVGSGPNPNWTAQLSYDRMREKVVYYGSTTLQGQEIEHEFWTWDGATWVRLDIDSCVTCPEPRIGGVMTVDRDGQILLYGGVSSTETADVAIHIFGGGQWRSIVSTPGPLFRVGHNMVFDSHRRRALVIGGIALTRGDDGSWMWDGQRWLETTRQVPGPVRGRRGGELAYSGEEQGVVLAGGRAPTLPTQGLMASAPPSPDTWGLKPDGWRQLGQTTPLWGHVAIRHPDGQSVVMTGGLLDDPTLELNDRTFVLFGGRWFSAPGGLPRWRASGFLDTTRNRAIVLGGADPRQNVGFLDQHVFNGVSWSRSLASGLGAFLPRFYARADYMRHADIAVLFGGLNGDGELAEGTWLWNGARNAWTRFIPPTGTTEPPRRYRHSLTYDPVRQVVVLFGGCSDYLATGSCPSTARFSDTWEFDGTRWIERHLSTAPPSRDDHAAAYDLARSAVVVYGGARTESINETWLYDGAEWRELGRRAPQPRAFHGMAWDEQRQAVVLYGGCTDIACENTLGDAWQWSGAGWIPIVTDNVGSGLGDMAMTTLPGGGVVTFGGRDRQMAVSFRQRLIGETWSLAQSTGTTPNSGASAVFDADDQKVVVFGRTNSGGRRWLVCGVRVVDRCGIALGRRAARQTFGVNDLRFPAATCRSIRWRYFGGVSGRYMAVVEDVGLVDGRRPSSSFGPQKCGSCVRHRSCRDGPVFRGGTDTAARRPLDSAGSLGKGDAGGARARRRAVAPRWRMILSGENLSSSGATPTPRWRTTCLQSGSCMEILGVCRQIRGSDPALRLWPMSLQPAFRCRK